MSPQQSRRSTSSESQPTRDLRANESDEPDGSQPSETAQFIPLDWIRPAQYQPRQYFDEKAMQELTASIKQNGILQPLLVRPVGEKYEVVAGECRYRAAQVAGLVKVPLTVRDMTAEQALQYALVENLQREDLNPVEETEGILQLLAINLNCPIDEVKSLLYRMKNEWEKAYRSKPTDDAASSSTASVPTPRENVSPNSELNPSRGNEPRLLATIPPTLLEAALREYIQRRQQLKVVELFWTVGLGGESVKNC